MDSVSQPRFDASFPCKGLVCHISDMCIWWFWKKIWHSSISGNICLIEVSNPAKFDAFIKKRTISSLNSWTIKSWTSIVNKDIMMHLAWTTDAFLSMGCFNLFQVFDKVNALSFMFNRYIFWKLNSYRIQSYLWNYLKSYCRSDNI